jgi:MFS family permease
VLGALIALAAICPFVGSMSDLFGRRYVALGGATILLVGVVVMSTAKIMNTFIAGSVLCGAGAAINEMTAVSMILSL